MVADSVAESWAFPVPPKAAARHDVANSGEGGEAALDEGKKKPGVSPAIKFWNAVRRDDPHLPEGNS